MHRLLNMIRWDLDLQARNYIMVMNAVSTAVIIAFVLLIGPPVPASVASFFIFADPALIGLSLTGAIVLMEKSARVLSALGVAPSPPWVYVASKTVTMTGMGALSALAVAWVGLGGAFDWPLMILAVLLSNIIAVLIGFACVARAPSMNAFMTYLLMVAALLFAALPAHFGILPDWGVLSSMLLPSYAMLLALNGAADPSSLSAAQWSYAIGYQLVWIALGWAWSLHEFSAHIVTEGR